MKQKTSFAVPQLLMVIGGILEDMEDATDNVEIVDLSGQMRTVAVNGQTIFQHPSSWRWVLMTMATLSSVRGMLKMDQQPPTASNMTLSTWNGRHFPS